MFTDICCMCVCHILNKDYYIIIRPIMEYACPVWHPSLTTAPPRQRHYRHYRKSHKHHISCHGLQTITDHGPCRHAGGPMGSVDWTLFQKERHTGDFLSFTTYCPTEETDIVNKLRQPKIFKSLAINTVKFSKSFIPYCLKYYH